VCKCGERAGPCDRLTVGGDALFLFHMRRPSTRINIYQLTPAMRRPSSSRVVKQPSRRWLGLALSRRARRLTARKVA
jgi:hypothetical protein